MIKVCNQRDLAETLYYLMNKDTVVAVFSLNTPYFEKKGILPITDESNIVDWIKKRAKFSCARNVKEFFKNIGIKTLDDYIDLFHCVSLSDTFWVVNTIDKKVTWKRVSPFKNNYSKLVSTYALDGIIDAKYKSGSYNSPDVATDGTFPHSWKWKNNGELVFVKASSKYTLGGRNSGQEPLSEYFASVVCEYLGIKHINYRVRKHRRHDNKIDLVTECNVYTTEEVGSVAAYKLDLNSYKEVLDYAKHYKNGAEIIADMLFIDNLLMNTDRHFGNIEFFVVNETQEIVGVVPIFDNNMSFIPRWIEGLDEYTPQAYLEDSNVTSIDDEWNVFVEYIKESPKRINRYRFFLNKLKKFKLEKPKSVKVADARLAYLQDFLNKQISYLERKLNNI